MFGRQKVAAIVAEFLGAGLLALTITTVQRATGAQFYVGIAAGVTFGALVLFFGAVSGGFNPAITLGQWVVRRIGTVQAIAFIAAQMLGGWAAYALYNYFSKTNLQAIGGEFTVSVMVAEAFGTFILAMGVAAAIYRRYTLGAVAAVCGLAYMIGIVAASPAAIGMLNPAVALGADAWVWKVYVLGPVIGSILGFVLYRFLFAPTGVVVIEEETIVVETATTAPSVTTTKVTKKPVAKKKVAAKATKAKATTRKKK